MPGFRRKLTPSRTLPHNPRVPFAASLLIVAILILSGCGTFQNDRSWGEDATLTPSSNRLKQAFFSAAKHPGTWSPLLGATVLSAGNIDEEISEQLAEDTPVFGNNQDANDASDFFRDSLVASVAVSALTMPAGNEPGSHAVNKTRGILVEAAALKATSLVTTGIKDASGRERPNKANDKSFPSGHASRAFAAAALTSKNLESLELTPATQTGIRTGLYTFATLTAWARIEARVHYPSDVLAGAALGNFLSRFIHDAFLGLGNNEEIVQIEIMPKHTQVMFSWYF